MKKLNVLFTTVAFALGLLLVTPAAMADPKVGKFKVEKDKPGGSRDVATCIVIQLGLYPDIFGPPFDNFGQCVKASKGK